MTVEMLAPQERERILDPACGTGGFLVATLAYMLARFRGKANVAVEDESTEEFISIHDRLRHFAQNQVFGADFDPFLIKASQMNMVMISPLPTPTSCNNLIWPTSGNAVMRGTL